MIKKILCASMVLAGLSVSTFAATAAAGFYVEQDAKTHACMVSDKAADGKLMMDVGTKVYASKANAEQAMANLKVCAAAVAPATKPAAAGFYVEQDSKTHACMVTDKAPDGKTMMDVGTKIYATKGNAEQAKANLKVCAAAMTPAAKPAATLFIVISVPRDRFEKGQRRIDSSNRSQQESTRAPASR